MRQRVALLICGLFAAPAFAAKLDVSVEVPQLDVAEYHRPYVAVWIEREDSTVAANLAVWYQQERAQKREQKPGDRKPGEQKGGGKGPQNGGGGEDGTKWLPDLRQWWRRSGRGLTMPVDGVSGATRPVGAHVLTFDAAQAPLKDLAPGTYRIVVEAAREVGGRELLKLPLTWPITAAQKQQAQGKTELGAVSVDATP